MNSPWCSPKLPPCSPLVLVLSPGRLTAGHPWPAPTGPSDNTQLLHCITPSGHITVTHFSVFKQFLVSDRLFLQNRFGILNEMKLLYFRYSLSLGNFLPWVATELVNLNMYDFCGRFSGQPPQLLCSLHYADCIWWWNVKTHSGTHSSIVCGNQ